MKEQLLQSAEAIKAFANGEPVQVLRFSGVWDDVDSPIWNIPERSYRPKPSPKTRDWNCAADFPADCWLRDKRKPDRAWRVLMIDDEGFHIFNGVWECHRWSQHDFSNNEHSTDRKAWKPCVVT